MKKRVIFLVKALTSIGLLVYFFSRVGVRQIYWSIRAIPVSLWFACFLILVCANFFMVLRWRMVVRHLKLDLGVGRSMKLYFLGLFFNNFLPSAVGGDFVKAYYLAQDTHSYRAPFLSIFLDRYIGLHFMILSAGILSLILDIHVQGRPIFNYLLTILLGLLTVNGFMLSRYSRLLIDWVEKRIPKAKGKLDIIYAGVRQILEDRRLILLFMLFSTGYIILLGYVHHLIIYKENSSIGIVHSITFLILVNCAIFLPLSIGGIGVREGLYLYLYSSYGVPSPQILALSSIYFTLVLAISLIGFPIFLAERENFRWEKTLS